MDPYERLTREEIDELSNRFIYHQASSDEIVQAHGEVTERTLRLAKWLTGTLPPSRGLSLALTKLEEVRMWANQAIATGQKLREDSDGGA